jgi:hypothetical protein
LCFAFLLASAPALWHFLRFVCLSRLEEKKKKASSVRHSGALRGLLLFHFFLRLAYDLVSKSRARTAV